MTSATTTPVPEDVRVRRLPLSAPWLFVGVVIAVRLLVATYHVELPGLNYDEVLFVNAATDRFPGVFIFKTWGDFPIMLMQYIGALKAWLYTPWFWLVDPSPATIRLPMVALTSVSLALLFAGLQRLIDTRTALLAFVFLAVDANLFSWTRMDIGPTALAFFCKALAIYGVARLIDGWKLRWAVLLVVAVGLGVFNKLNFIWVVNAAVLVAAVLAWHHRATLRRHARPVVVIGVGVAAIYVVFVWYALWVDLASQQSERSLSGAIALTWPRMPLGVESLLSGTSFRELLTAPPVPVRSVGFVAAIVLGFAALGTVLAALPRTRNVFVAATGILALAIVPQMLVTEDATAPWHYIELYPFVLICAAYGVKTAVSAVTTEGRTAVPALAVAALAVTAYQGGQLATLYYRLDQGVERQGSSPAIYALEESLDLTSAPIFLTDWGMQNQLMALDNRAPYGNFIQEAFAIGFDTATQADLDAFASRVAGSNDSIVVVAGPQATNFAASRVNALRALEGRLELTGTFRGPSGLVMFEVYRYRAAPAPAPKTPAAPKAGKKP